MNLYGFAGGDPISYSDPFGLCKVELRARLVPHGGGAVHTFVTTTEPDNTRTKYYRGGPAKHNADESTEQREASRPDGPGPGYWGDIATTSGDFQPGTVDWKDQVGATTVVDNDEPCDKYNESFSSTLKCIEDARIPYAALGTNSNSTAFQLLISAGIKPPANAGTVNLRKRAPGWGRRLLPW